MLCVIVYITFTIPSIWLFSGLFYQARGIDDRNKLPYFPYRDDGEIIYKAIEDLMKDIVNLWVQIKHHTTNTNLACFEQVDLSNVGITI